METVDRSVGLLRLMRGEHREQEPIGIKIITVQTTDPSPLTFTFDGTPVALDIDIFEIPVSLYPLRKGDRLFVFPLVGRENGQRWAALEKINGGVTMATMTSASSLKVAGIDKTYGAADLVLPRAGLQAGDQVSITPTLVGSKIKYVILERY